jgi:hypothetical protein
MLCAQPLLAQGEIDTLSQKLVTVSQWTMSAPLNKPAPDCVETWTIRADGSMTIKSGSERVEKHWRIAGAEGSLSLYLRRMSSTGGVDCLGDEYEPFDEPQPEAKDPLWVLAFKEGETLLLCNPQYVTETNGKQTRFFGDNCWGKLEPTK